jgi:cobalt-zinc-cadmium efflux system outer membrane protein
LRIKAGEIPEPDFPRINMKFLKAQAELNHAEAAIEQAQGNLAVILNWPDTSMQFVAEDKWPEIRDIGQNLAREVLINKALLLRPDLQADIQRADQADKELILAGRLKYPDVTLIGGFARDPSNTILNTGFVGVGIPIPLFYQYKGEVSKATVNLSQTRLTAEKTKLAVRNDVVASLAAWKSAEKVVRLFESELLAQASQVRDRTKLAYTKGKMSVPDFIDAQHSYKATMLEYYSAMIKRINAYYDLAKSIGVEPNADRFQHAEESIRINTDSLHKDN